MTVYRGLDKHYQGGVYRCIKNNDIRKPGNRVFRMPLFNFRSSGLKTMCNFPSKNRQKLHKTRILCNFRNFFRQKLHTFFDAALAYIQDQIFVCPSRYLPKNTPSSMNLSASETQTGKAPVLKAVWPFSMPVWNGRWRN